VQIFSFIEMKKLLLSLVVIIMMSGLVVAQCQVTVNSDSTRDFLKEIPTIDQALKVCPRELPNPLNFLFKNQRVKMDIDMTDGATEIIITEIKNGFLSGISWGGTGTGTGTGTGYTISMSECAFDTALRNGNSMGVYSYLYQQNEITLTGSGLTKRILLFLLSPFINSATQKAQTPVTIECSERPGIIQNPGAILPGGKPNNCDETYLPGHPGYAQNKALWEGYSLDADKVCQTRERTGTPTPNTCIHTVQLSVGGTPYYLCWYNE